MRRYWLLVGGVLLVLILVFVAAEAAGVGEWPQAVALVKRGGAAAGFVSVGLLVADVVLPVPSSLVMLLNGTAFGVAGGAALSVLGGVGSAALGFALGRRGGPLLSRLVPAEERARADALLERWGALAVAATRPIPLLAETVLLLAGASPMRWPRLLLSSLFGVLPGAVLYAWAGAASAKPEVGAWVFVGAIAMSAVLWFVGRKQGRSVVVGR